MDKNKRPAAAACKESWCFAFKIISNHSSSDCESVKLVALSEYDILRHPLLDVNRRKKAMQAAIVESDMSSKRTILRAKQINNARYALLLSDSGTLWKNGLPKSNPMSFNDPDHTRIFSLGEYPISGCPSFPVKREHVTQFKISCALVS